MHWYDWWGVIGSTTTVVAFILYLWELFKRKQHDKLMIGFLHGLKPLGERPEAGPEWQGVIRQVNDMLQRLDPPKKH